MSEERQTGTGGRAEQPGDTKIERATTIGALLQKRRAEFERVLPKHLSVDRVLRVAVSAVSRNRTLLVCDQSSLLRGVMQAAILGLEIDVNGEAYLVPFYNAKRGVHEAVMIAGYKGLIKLMRQSREVESVHAGFAREGDFFDFDVGDRAYVKHKPALVKRSEDPGASIAYYCAVRTRGAQFPQVTVLNPWDVEQHRQRSRAKDSGPWITDYDAMGTKTVIRVASKTAPASVNLARTLALEDRAEAGVGAASTDIFPELEALDEGSEEPVETQPTTTATEVEKEIQQKEKAHTAKPKPPREPGEEG